MIPEFSCNVVVNANWRNLKAYKLVDDDNSYGGMGDFYPSMVVANLEATVLCVNVLKEVFLNDLHKNISLMPMCSLRDVIGLEYNVEVVPESPQKVHVILKLSRQFCRFIYKNEKQDFLIAPRGVVEMKRLFNIP